MVLHSRARAVGGRSEERRGGKEWRSGGSPQRYREKGISVVEMGLVRSVRAAGGQVRVELLLTSGWCPFASRVLTEIQDRIEAQPGVTAADVEIVWDEAWTTDRLSERAARGCSPRSSGSCCSGAAKTRSSTAPRRRSSTRSGRCGPSWTSRFPKTSAPATGTPS